MLLALLTPCMLFAGTFRDDFEKEADYVADSQLRDGGVWGEDISAFTWDNGSIRGIGPVDLFLDLVTGTRDLDTQTVECRVKVITWGREPQFPRDDMPALPHVGMIFRRPCIDSRAAYILGLKASSVSFYHVTNMPKVLAREYLSFTPGVWYALKIVVDGGTFACWIDGKKALEAVDRTIETGMAGFFVAWGTVANFDDFVLTGPDVVDGGHWDPAAHR
ncbi:MAG TPA: hypothetical protein VLH81_12760 [Desulfobacterales bacterium]|nr:hypothetical protein [Desulfobacterales bacterium]